MSEPSVPARQLQSFEPFFSSIPVHPEGTAPDFLHPLMEMRGQLPRTERRITLLGAVKTGKSSLLNALLGARLVPVRAHRTIPAVTVIEYGPVPKATIMRRGADPEEILFDALRALEWKVEDASGVQELRLSVPFPLLSRGAVLIDMPGLLESPALDEVTYQELFEADLAVLVLAADKILSARERELAAWANELLHGNIVFVVNRMDLIDEEDRDDVIEWARSALRDAGNDLVGRARIFATSAGPRPAAAVSGTQQLNAWLAELLASELSDRVATVSRLGILENLLRDVAARAQEERTRAESAEADARERHLERVMTERAGARKAFAEGRLRLQAVQERLPSFGDALVSHCLDDARRNLTRYHDEEIRALFQAALAEYAGTVREQVAVALSGVPVTPAPFRLSGWIFRTRLDPVPDPARELGSNVGDVLTRIVDGGRAGREAGAAIGGWIGKNVLGRDTVGEFLRRIEAVARGAVGPAQAEAEQHLAELFGLLDDADSRYQTWTSPSTEVDEAERYVRYWTALGIWCDGFLRAVRLATDQVLSGSGGDRS